MTRSVSHWTGLEYHHLLPSILRSGRLASDAISGRTLLSAGRQEHPPSRQCHYYYYYFRGTHCRKELRLPIYYYFEEIDQYVKDVHGLH